MSNRAVQLWSRMVSIRVCGVTTDVRVYPPVWAIKSWSKSSFFYLAYTAHRHGMGVYDRGDNSVLICGNYQYTIISNNEGTLSVPLLCISDHHSWKHARLLEWVAVWCVPYAALLSSRRKRYKPNYSLDPSDEYFGIVAVIPDWNTGGNWIQNHSIAVWSYKVKR